MRKTLLSNFFLLLTGSDTFISWWNTPTSWCHHPQTFLFFFWSSATSMLPIWRFISDNILEEIRDLFLWEVNKFISISSVLHWQLSFSCTHSVENTTICERPSVSWSEDHFFLLLEAKLFDKKEIVCFLSTESVLVRTQMSFEVRNFFSSTSKCSVCWSSFLILQTILGMVVSGISG